MGVRRPGQRWPITSIDRDRLLKQSQRLKDSLFRYWKETRKRAQIEIIGAEVGRRPRGGSVNFGRLQCRLDDAGDTDGDFVLKFEHVFERAIEAVGPEMRSSLGVNQLRGDAHPVPALADRAFEDIADAEFAADLLHVDRLALVGEGRIPGDDEEPANTGEGRNDLLDHPVDEIFLLRVAAHVGERQHRDRRLVGRGGPELTCVDAEPAAVTLGMSGPAA